MPLASPEWTGDLVDRIANIALLQGIARNLRCMAWDDRAAALDGTMISLSISRTIRNPQRSHDASGMGSALVPI